jgi:NAD kinase
VLIVAKLDDLLVPKVRAMVEMLLHMVAGSLAAEFTVSVEDQIHANPLFRHPTPVQDARLRSWNADAIRQAGLHTMASPIAGQSSAFTGAHMDGAGAVPPSQIDLIITLGGDGTVLHAAWLFQRLVRYFRFRQYQ